jgi:carbonic anhydrase/acetyltransferase-like protein (isoleucine patch superfamily)
MSTTVKVKGVVTNGVVVPSSPLPEGTRVEIHLQVRPEVTPELQEEFDGWERAGAGTVEMVERLAEEMEADEKR